MEPTLLCALAALAAAMATAEPPAAPPATPDPAPRVEIPGFVDLVYAYGFNRPADEAHWFDGVGTAAKRDNELSINLAQIDFVVPAAPVGLHLAAGFGTALEVVHASEPVGTATSEGAWEHL